MEQAMLQYIRGRDFLAPEDNLARIRERPAQLVWGVHRSPAPLVTIAIPAYRRADLLREALKSALDQRGFTDYQILIADDSALPEGEVSEIEQLVRALADERILYYRNRENLGLMDNWNMSYYLCQSPWVCSLHDDDLLPQNYLEKMAACVQKYPRMDALYNLAVQFEADSCTPARQAELTAPAPVGATRLRVQRVWRQNFGFAAGRATGSFVRRDAFLRVGGFGIDRLDGGSDILYNDDYCLAVRLFANCRCYILPQRIYNYRIGANNGSARVRDYLPDLVQEYYIGRQLSGTRCVLWRWLFYKRNKYQTLRNARHLDALVQAGGVRMNPDARVDFEALRAACGWKSLDCSPLGMLLADAVWKLYSLCRRAADQLASLPIEC